MNKLDYHFYFIDENLSSLDAQDLSPGPRVCKVKVGALFPKPKNSDGPFNSIRGLKKNSKKYNQYKSVNSKRAIKIVDQRWIHEITNHGIIFAPMGNSYPEEFIKSIEHATKGTIRKGEVSGVHYLDDDKIKVIEELNQNEQGVFKARLQILDSSNGEWVEKKNPSTFFPRNWSLNQLFHACGYAYFEHQKELVQGKKLIYRSKTKSGIDVEIIMDGEKIKTIYPIL